MRRRDLIKAGLLGGAAALPALAAAPPARAAGDSRVAATGSLGLVIERATGSVLVVETTGRRALARIGDLGDLSHASAVFSPDARFAYVFGRDGGLTQIDLVELRIARRIVQAGNAIGGAISDDGRLIAVSNYEPGGVKVFEAATLDPVVEIPAECGQPKLSKTVGLVDAPGRRFVYSLYDGGEIWIADFSGPDARKPAITRLTGVGKLPYDAGISGDGRHYIAGLFGEDGLVHVDLWDDKPVARRVLSGYGRGEAPLPVYKMPHLEGWALMGGRYLLPAIGRHELLAVAAGTFTELGRVAVHGQPIFAVSRPDGRHAWVNFAHPLNDTVDVVDARSLQVIHRLKPGPAVLHLEFTPRGHEVWVSVRDANRVDIYDTRTFAKVAELPAEKPSGILFAARAFRIGQ
jgi:protein NirF